MWRLPTFLFLFGLAVRAAFAGDVSYLGVGEQRSLPVARGVRFSVGNPEVLQVKSTQLEGGGSLLLVKGRSQGYSDVLILAPDGKQKAISFRVVTKVQQAVTKDTEGVFSGRGVKLETQGAGWLLRGQAQALDDWNAAKVVESQGKGKIQSLVRIHPLERLKAEQRLRTRLRHAGLEGIDVVGVGNAIVLRGDLADAQEKELAEKLAEEVYRGVRSHLRVPFERSRALRFHAKILELLNSDARVLGLDWSASVPGAIQIGKSVSKFQFQFDSVLKMLEKRGKARILSQPQLLLNEKGVAELKVGGEIPVPVRGRSFTAVQWKAYGLQLRLEVPGASQERARAKISVEISGLDPSTAIEGIPGMRVSRLETTADLEQGSPVLLSGLMESRKAESLSGLALLGDIPVLGELFRSRDFQQNRSELVIWLEARKP